MKRYIVEYEAKEILNLPTEDAIDELGSDKLITNEGLHFRNLSHISVILTDEQVKRLKTKGLNPTPEKKEDNVCLGVDYERVFSLHHKTKKKAVNGTGVKVAVLDSGCNDAINIVDVTAGYNFITNTSNWVDGYGHGTRVCSIIKTLTATGCELHAVKMISDGGSTTESAVLAGIDYCIDNEIHFMNLSWTFYTTAVNEAIEQCINAGIVVCAAAGNDTEEWYTLLPASLPGVVAVNAITEARQPVYRNVIPMLEVPGSHGIDVACAGWASESISRLNSYSASYGTSFACPFFVATLACYKQELNESDNYRVLDYVYKTLKKVEDTTYFGRGLVTF